MDRKPLPIGVDNFEKLITRGYYFIDKTDLIKDLLDKKGDVNLFTRPRRFGKTLNMSMIKYFFEDMRNAKGERIDNSALFDGLNIMQAGGEYLLHMGKYPVINVSLKEGQRPTFEGAYTQLSWQIAMEYERHCYVLEGMSKDHSDKYKRIMYEKASLEEYSNSLHFLSRCLETYYGKKVIILIDEYDVPLENAYTEGFYKEMVGFMRTLFGSALKTNSSLEFAVITGCLRISEESTPTEWVRRTQQRSSQACEQALFTGLNNLNIISILDENYDEYFGFTDDEVRKICGSYNLSDRYEMAKEWYNGYIFGMANIYNPWSVIKFVSDQYASKEIFPKSYWANTSSNSIVRKLIARADESVKGEIENLINGGIIEKPIHEDITYDEVYKTMDNLWNFMFFTGYFRKVSEKMNEDGTKMLAMRIPNKEVRYIFIEKISGWFQEKIQEKDFSNLYSAFVNKDTGTVEEELTQILFDTISSFDATENYYHGLVAGIMSGMRGYQTRSNRESGKGRCDLFIKPLSRKKEAFVVEFKVTKKIKELESKADEALKQIEDRGYIAELNDNGYDIVSKYGIAFCGKDCLVKVKG